MARSYDYPVYPTSAESRERILQAIRDGNNTVADIRRVTELSETTIFNAVNMMTKEGAIVMEQSKVKRTISGKRPRQYFTPEQYVPKEEEQEEEVKEEKTVVPRGWWL